jgi:hypothetical protein
MRTKEVRGHPGRGRALHFNGVCQRRAGHSIGRAAWSTPKGAAGMSAAVTILWQGLSPILPSPERATDALGDSGEGGR